MALFKINGTAVKKLTAKDLDLERNLQELFEANLEDVLSIVFLAHEYSTSFGGRIDTLGIDKNGSPCIIEYKKTKTIMLSIKSFRICAGSSTTRPILRCCVKTKK